MSPTGRHAVHKVVRRTAEDDHIRDAGHLELSPLDHHLFVRLEKDFISKSDFQNYLYSLKYTLV